MQNRVLELALRWVLLATLAVAPAIAPAAASPWTDTKLPPDVRASLVERQMTQDEKIALVHGSYPHLMKSRPASIPEAAGYVAGVPRLSISPLFETDASLGVANAGRTDDDAVSLPSGLAIAATWDTALAQSGGAMIGKEARQKGFNVMLAGGANLTRDPFNGRNFEYLGEDPLLTGVMAGSAIRGIQSEFVISTAKHLVLNAQETGRHTLNARISEAGLRESDLLAFEIALEQGHPGSVMCGYNSVNGTSACENKQLLTSVLRHDWHWKGWVMSDWGSVHSEEAALAGLDQESGGEIDRQVYFDGPLREAITSRQIPQVRLDEMVHRILRSMFAVGVIDHAIHTGGLNTTLDAAMSLRVAEAGIVLLKNDARLLPIAANAHRIAVIGGYADKGVLSGGGATQVVPLGSIKLPAPPGAPSWSLGVFLHPSSPLQAIRERGGGDKILFDDGEDVAAATEKARAAEIAVVFVTQWTTEAMDCAYRLSPTQENLIQSISSANPKTIVVLENGGPMLMPWIDQVPAVIETWYPGSRGGEAIARILFGEVDPSGRLPITFALRGDQLPRTEPVGLDKVGPEGTIPKDEPSFPIDYVEGSSVGYRWFAEHNQKPLFPFGYGLSYTQFGYSNLAVAGGNTLVITLALTNQGQRRGAEVAQVYLRAGPARSQQRLLGWVKATLEPGETRRVSITADPRLLANWDESGHGWRVAEGRYFIFAGPNADAATLEGSATVKGAFLKP